jgi:hypothetical protein
MSATFAIDHEHSTDVLCLSCIAAGFAQNVGCIIPFASCWWVLRNGALALLHSCTLALLHSCTLALLHSCTLALLHSCTLALLHSCTLTLLWCSCSAITGCERRYQAKVSGSFELGTRKSGTQQSEPGLLKYPVKPYFLYQMKCEMFKCGIDPSLKFCNARNTAGTWAWS